MAAEVSAGRKPRARATQRSAALLSLPWSLMSGHDEREEVGAGRGGVGAAGSKYCTAPERVVNRSAAPIQAIEEAGSCHRPHRISPHEVGWGWG